jgi:hypothetical protein
MKNDFQQADLKAPFHPPLDKPLSPAATLSVNILTLAKKFNFCVEDENDGLGQELYQTFRLRDGRPFALNFLVHSQHQDGYRTDIHVSRDPATQKKDVQDIMNALDIGDEYLLEEYPFSPPPADTGMQP